MNKIKIFASLLSLLSCICFTQDLKGACCDRTQLDSEFGENRLHYAPARAYVGQTFGRGVGYNSGYTTVGVWFGPAKWNCVRPFLDVRGHIFKQHKWAGNAGGGIRFLCPSLRRVFGFNTYYDYRRAKRDYHQVGVGLEVLGPCYDLRLNGYFPVGHHTHATHPRIFDYPGGWRAICRRKQHALRGVDGEISTSLRKLCPCWCSCWDLYVGLGAYAYPQECGKNANGGRFRLGIAFLDRIRLEVKVSDDDVFGTRFQGYIAFSFPLYICEVPHCCQDDCLESLAEQPVERQEIIVTGHEKCSWKTNF